MVGVAPPPTDPMATIYGIVVLGGIADRLHVWRHGYPIRDRWHREEVSA